MPRLLSSLLLSLGIASSASAVTMDWTPIGNAGNAADTQVMNDGTTGYGAVSYTYSIGTYEVTNAQYAEFLNAKAASDPLGLYNPVMGMGGTWHGGIARSGSDGSYTYSAIAGRENMPVNWVSSFDAFRFANWMTNGQGNGDTESGSYTLLGGTATPSNPWVARNVSATIMLIVLTSEDEWYKAAYYDSTTSSYFDYPAGSNTETTCATPTATSNSANCFSAVDDSTPVGSYPGSPSPYGTFDQGGNVAEWNEAIIPGQNHGIRGGSFFSRSSGLAAAKRGYAPRTYEDRDIGFRVAMLPEPNTELLEFAGVVGLLGLAGWRRRNT
jgi:formylglycine-generating enzyme required for sulfatase activity